MSWDSPAIYALYALWLVIAALTVKLLITRRHWQHPLRGNGPMLIALLLILVNTEVARGQTVQYANHATPPPYWPSVIVTYIATLFIIYWLWRQLELIPTWIRRHLPWKRTGADYTTEEHDHHAADRR